MVDIQWGYFQALLLYGNGYKVTGGQHDPVISFSSFTYYIIYIYIKIYRYARHFLHTNIGGQEQAA